MSKAKELVKNLQSKPRDPVALKAAKRHLIQEKRYKSLAKVMEWWSKRAPTPQAGAQELFEAASLVEAESKDLDRAQELYTQVVELDPDHQGARERLDVLAPDEEFDDLMDALTAESVRPGRRSSLPPVAQDPIAPSAPLPAPSGKTVGKKIPSVRPPSAASAGSRIPSLRRPAPEPSAAPLPPPAFAAPPPVAPAPPAAAPSAAVPKTAPEPFPPLAPPPSVAAFEVEPSHSSQPQDEGDEDDATQPRFESEAPAAPEPVAEPLFGGASVAMGVDEDDDEEDENAPSSFDVNSILGVGPSPVPAGGRGAVMEVVRLRGDTVLGLSQVRMMGNGGSDALRIRRSGLRSFSVVTREPAQGWVMRADAPEEVASQPVAAEPTKLSLNVGDAAELAYHGVVHRLRVVNRLPPPVRDRAPLPYARYLAVLVASLTFHGVGLAGVATMHRMGVTFVVEDRSQDEIFAEARLKPEPEQKPKPKPKPRVLSRRKAPKPPPQEEKVQIPKSLRKRLKNIARTRTKGDATSRLVAALKSPVAGEGKTLQEVVSNIDAVKGSSSSAAFKVGGTLAGIEGSGVNIVSGGGGEIGTLSGNDATGKLTRLTAKKGGKVRGKVRSVSALAKVQGSLSRGEVLKVLNQNTRKIQRCYERQLTSNPSLAGKLAYSWTIKTNGRVSSVKQKSNTMGNTAVAKCIGGVIKGMKFPRPKGGSVSVTFPWIFQRAP